MISLADHFLCTEHLDVGYNGDPLIRDICIDIRKGEIVTLIGPNGAGKSTILKSISRQLRILRGNVVISGEDLLKIPRNSFSRKMAVMLTERTKPELMTCYEIAAAGRYPYTGHLGILSEEDERKVEEALDAVHAGDLGTKDFNAVSDGQKQRVLLARAFCQEPEILVLDEPTSFLDIRHKLDILTILRKMASEKKITVVMSLHEIDLAQKISDRILCVKGDRILRFGIPEEIFREDVIRELYEIRSGSYDPLFGSLELGRPEGDPKVFVISSCGKGIPVYRKLQREGIPFAAGILYENDIDYEAAVFLASEIITEKPFEPVSEGTLEKAKSWISRCESVIFAGGSFGSGNSRVRELIEYAKSSGKLNNHADAFKS